MKRKAAIVVNPRTGQNFAKITDVLAVLAAAGWKTELAVKEYGGHTMRLARRLSEQKSDLVIAYGGDGTLNQVLNGVLASTRAQKSLIGLIPGGTANVWAGEVGIPRDPVLAALTLVNSEPQRVDVGRVDIEDVLLPEDDAAEKAEHHKKKGASGSKNVPHHFLLMAGLGIDAEIMGNVSKPLKQRLGPLAVGLSAAKKLPEHRAFPVEIATLNAQKEREILWQGEALQIVIGNTRRYADLAEMTPEAYIDDGRLDICVITGGNPLTTIEQVTSLLLRRKPDDLSAEYFQEEQFTLRVPASVPLQLDGSALKQKDYLSKAEYDTLQKVEKAEDALVTYRFATLPKALTLAIPRTYDNALFASEREQAGEQVPKKQHEKVALKSHHHRRADEYETAQQQQTKREEAPAGKPEEHKEQAEGAVATEHETALQTQQTRAEIEHIVRSGRKVTVVGKVPNPELQGTFIIAGGTPKPMTGEIKPVAVVVDAQTHLYSRDGSQLTLAALEEVQAGMLLIVEGKKSKRGVIQAVRMVL